MSRKQIKSLKNRARLEMANNNNNINNIDKNKERTITRFNLRKVDREQGLGL